MQDLEPPDPVVLVNPYTEPYCRGPPTRPGSSTGLSIHRSMWAGGGIVGQVLRHALSWSVLLLFFMALSGRGWPKSRGVELARLFKINFSLKGMPFCGTCIRHGTCVLLIYLMTAHTGLMIGRQLSWYRDNVMAFRQSLGMTGLPPSPDKPSRIDPMLLDPIWRDFNERQPAYRVSRIELPAVEGGAVIIRSGTQQLNYDPRSGTLTGSATIPDGDARRTDRRRRANLNEPW
jgi:hypothetical protein